MQNPSFSGTVSSLFGALLNGAAVAPFDLQGEGLPAISQWLQRARVTVFHAVPSIFRQLSDPLNRFPAVRLIRLEGDRAAPLDIEHFQANFQDSCTLVNGLGATECGLVRQFFVDKKTALGENESVPVGYPVTDMTVRVVDDRGHELPLGAAGEIVVESRFLANGYWRNGALTAQRFIELDNGLRRYRTGDLGRMSEGGCLFHLGRVDQRLRIGGEFVAPADVERILLSVAGVQQAAVRDFSDQLGERRLCAYLVADPAVSAGAVRAALSDRIAISHLPSAFVFLDALPLTKDLKVDYSSLPPPGRNRPRLANDYVAPGNETEQQMARIWSVVLELDEVGVTDSFFDLGGDSIRAARFVTLFKEQQGLAIPVTSVYEHLTIRALVHGLEDDRPVAPETVAGANQENHALPAHSIAIIGMAGRFPGADSIEQFWHNLRAGVESLTVLPRESSEPSPAAVPDAVAARGLLANVDQFDAALFRLTPRQAQMLDPQQRLWLECVHRALEDAGLPVSEAGYAGANANIGVFAGGNASTYLWHLLGGSRDAVDALLQRTGDEAHQLAISNDTDSLATRTSFVMGFTGPSINVQTACSTSLVAVAQACQALSSRQCDIAIAGGVAVRFPQTDNASRQVGGIHSQDGHCRAFDARATGTVFSDGVGVVVLKRLGDAERDGDRIDALIRGWAVNNDGSNKASFAAPSVNGQAAVIARAQAHANVRPRDVSYVEAHGTGTPVGDPIEFAALARAFRRGAGERRVCAMGSVKTNIGHLDAAAGIAGLIKTVLALKHREIPATLHFEKANPEIDLDASPFYIVDRLIPWPTDGDRRIAGVSSFGIGGTNCHIVLQDAALAAPLAVQTALPAHLLTFSAASAAALDELAGSYRQFLAENPMADLAGIAAASQKSRSHYSHRAAIVGTSVQQLRASLSQDRGAGGVDRHWRGKAVTSANPEIGFLFAGQGTQYVNMGREIYQASGDFRRVLERCDKILRDQLERPLLDVMFGASGELIHRTDYAQPALFALEFALAELLQSWGIKPKFVMGHSLGEYVAACVAGVFTLEDGLRLAAARGRLMQQLPGAGKMLAVTAEQTTLDALLRRFPAVAIAAINSPSQTVLSGAADAIDRLQAMLQAQGTYCRELKVSHGFHSAQMEPVLAPLRQLISKTELQAPRLCLIGNLHGRAVTTEVTDPEYWCQQARQPVQFAAGFRTMVQAGCDLFVEIGPDAVFSALTQESSAQQKLDVVPTLRRGDNDWAALLATIGRLYVRGVQVDWPALQKGQSFRSVSLPGYPYQRSRYWYDGALLNAQHRVATAPNHAAGHPLLGRRLRLPGAAEIRFESRFSQSAPQFLNDHRLFGISLPPAACHFAMLAQAAEFLGGTQGDRYRFEDLYLLRPLLLPDGCERDVQLIFKPDAQGWSLELTSAEVNEAAMGSEPWTAHMIGLSRAHVPEKTTPALPTIDLNAIKARCADMLSRSEFYSRIWANQGGTGSAFRWIETIWQGDQEALCRAVCPATILDAASYRLHPGLIEAACQVLHCCATIETEEQLRQNSTTFVPFSLDVLSLYDVKATTSRLGATPNFASIAKTMCLPICRL